jgi:anaerobic ribonucleoside-triphosphate reductase
VQKARARRVVWTPVIQIQKDDQIKGYYKEMETTNQTECKMNIIKRSGEEVPFDKQKIVNAISRANQEVDRIHQMNEYQIQAIADTITARVKTSPHAMNVEDIQEMVETGIMEMRGFEVAQKYVRYRYRRNLARKSNTTDDGILSLIDQANEEVKQENSNKNPVINSTQRDYMAGEVSKDLTKRILLPEDIVRLTSRASSTSTMPTTMRSASTTAI